MKLLIRNFKNEDIPVIARALVDIGWRDRTSTITEYLAEQTEKERIILVALADKMFAGYGTLVWHSDYSLFAEQKIPEIKDLNVLPFYRRKGIAGKLMDKLESKASIHSAVVGIGVGMYPDYGPAQRLYVKRGYIPDGFGLHSHGKPTRPGSKIVVDDDLVLFLTKKLF